MTTTTYYNLNIVEGTDIVNPLTVDNPNYEKIDEAMHDNAVSGVTLATEIANATVHAITRENSECAVIRFIATSVWKAGDTVTVDGVPVTALLPSGETLPDGAYVINANVLCILTGTNLTVYAERKKIDEANEIKYNNTNVAEAITKLNSSVNIESVSFTKGECVQNGWITRMGDLYIGNFVLDFSNLASNVEHVVASNFPTITSAAVLSVPNEYGQSGVCTITTKENSITARCTASNNYYYANLVWISKHL